MEHRSVQKMFHAVVACYSDFGSKTKMNLLFLCLVSICLNISTGAEWCYQSQVSCITPCVGPEQWNELAPTCQGQRQSPINIVTRRTVPDERLTPIEHVGYEETFSSLIKNNGHSVAVNLSHSTTISGGLLETTYKAVEMHFHWGTNGGAGSEHTIDGERYPMELHLVHMKQKYNSLPEAVRDPSGIAVLGFFFETSRSANKKYEAIIRSLGNIKKSGSRAALSGLSLDSLIPAKENRTTYYRYQGSLTTPACAESVVWTVFECTIPLSHEQLAAFSSLLFTDDQPMVGTFRPSQPLNGRKVYRSGSAAVLASSMLLAVSAVVAVGL